MLRIACEALMSLHLTVSLFIILPPISQTNRIHGDIDRKSCYHSMLYFATFPLLFFFFFFLRITHMQQQKDNLTAQANDTAAQQRALQEEAAGVKLALGNITSSLHQLALTDASPSPRPGQTQLDQTRPISHTTEVSSDSTCRALMECEVLLCNIIESFSPDGAGLIAARIWGAHYGSCNEAHIEVSVAFIFLESGQLTPLHFHFFFFFLISHLARRGGHWLGTGETILAGFAAHGGTCCSRGGWLTAAASLSKQNTVKYHEQARVCPL